MKKEFPERHDWRMVDSITISEIGEKISDCISADLLGERNFVPGLRMALNIFLEYLEEKNHA